MQREFMESCIRKIVIIHLINIIISFKNSISNHLTRNKNHCEAKITPDEIKDAINDLPNNKIPGTDGLPVGYYKFFDNGLLSKSLENSFELGQLSNSQRQGVLCLIPPKGKDLERI